MNKITVVLPTYNRLNLLKRAYASCMAQINQNFDLLVIDNHSTDGTQEYLEDIQTNSPDIHVIINSENVGSVKSIQRALDAVQTEWVTILCDDDYFEPEYVDAVLRKIEQTQKHLIITGFSNVDSEGKILFSALPMEATYGLNDILDKLFVSSKIEIAGISGCAFKAKFNEQNIQLKDYPKGFWTDAMIQAQLAISGEGAETICGALYNRLTWQGSESAFSMKTLKLYNEAQLLFKRDLGEILLHCDVSKQLRIDISSPPRLPIFFKITCKPILLALPFRFLDLSEFRRIFLPHPKYRIHYSLLFAVFAFCLVVPLNVRRIATRIARDCRNRKKGMLK